MIRGQKELMLEDGLFIDAGFLYSAFISRYPVASCRGRIIGGSGGPPPEIALDYLAGTSIQFLDGSDFETLM